MIFYIVCHNKWLSQYASAFKHVFHYVQNYSLSGPVVLVILVYNLPYYAMKVGRTLQLGDPSSLLVH